jgi:hypothetical protein
MYSLALIIFVVSEKKAFEHFPIGSNVNLCIDDHCKVLYKVYVFYADRKSKMATTAIHRLTLDPIVLRWRPSWISDWHKKHKFVEDFPMIIPGQFGFNCLLRNYKYY